MRTELIKSPVVFNDDEHTYWLGEKQLSGITGMLQSQLFPDMYKGVSEAVLNRAALKGTAVHTTIEFVDEFNISNGTIQADNYLRICEENNLTYEASEYIVSDLEHFASPIDKVYRVSDDEFILADIKTTATFHKEYVQWQLSIYATLFERQNPGAKVVGLAGIWLRDDKSKYVKVERIAPETIDALLHAEIAGEQFDNPLTKIETFDESQVALTDSLADIERQIKALTKQREEMVSNLKAAMEMHNVKKWETDSVKVTYVDATSRESFDSKQFKVDHSDLYEQYKKVSAVKASIKITLK